MFSVGSYLVYLAITVSVTVWVARTLQRSGGAFLVEAFRGNEVLADSVNHLLVVGFYLINIGYVSVALKTDSDLATLRTAIEVISGKIGVVLIVLGGMHFFNLLVLSKLRNSRLTSVSVAAKGQ